MANREKKIPLNEVNDMIEEIDPKCLTHADPIDRVKIGDMIYIGLPKYCRSLSLYRQHQYDEGIITKEEMQAGSIRVGEALFEINQSYEIVLTPEIRLLMKRGIIAFRGRTSRNKRSVSKVYTHEEWDKKEEKEKQRQEIYTCRETK